MKRIHIHVREKGSWSEQFALLFRDFLREHEEYRKLYAKEKYMLMNRYQNERHLYVEGKSNKTNFKINNNSKNIYEAGDDD